jgi:hypothetical protein
MANLFAFRATNPEDMMSAFNPVGEENDSWLIRLSNESEIIIAAWGNLGGFQDRDTQVLRLVKNIKCLKVNESGYPAHPLYQPKSAIPIPYLKLLKK